MAPKYAEGEKVLCFHGPLMYEAKCLKTTITKYKDSLYLIHYAGWNKRWDEWVPENRIFKYNNANLEKQKKVHKAVMLGARKAKLNPQAVKSEKKQKGVSKKANAKSVKTETVSEYVATRQKSTSSASGPKPISSKITPKQKNTRKALKRKSTNNDANLIETPK